MGQALATVVMRHRSGEAEDSVVNNFAIVTAGGAVSNATGVAIAGMLWGFYNYLHPGMTQKLAYYLSNGFDRTFDGFETRVYDVTGHLDGSPHGSPIATTYEQMVAAAVSSNSLPEEVALCMTLQATGQATAAVEVPDGIDPGAAPDRPKQRRTGRVYLGPFNTTALNTPDSLGRSRPTGALISNILAAADGLATELNGAGHNLAVWSRSDATMRNVVSASVDDAWDTQRRRGVRPTNKVQSLIGA